MGLFDNLKKKNEAKQLSLIHIQMCIRDRWYTPAEYEEVRRLMDADLADTRKQLDDQLKPIDDGWTKYSTGKDLSLIHIQMCIRDRLATTDL